MRPESGAATAVRLSVRGASSTPRSYQLTGEPRRDETGEPRRTRSVQHREAVNTQAIPSPVHPLGEVKLVPIGEVKPYGANPRKIPMKAIEQTAKSIREFGWQQPIVVDAELVIIAGHTRGAAAERAGSARRADRDR